MNTSQSRTNALFLTLSGLLLGIGFAPLPLGFLAYFGFVPLLIVLERSVSQEQGFLRILRQLYWAFFVFHGVSNWWVSSWQREADPYLMIAGITLWIGHPFFFAVPMLAYVRLRKRLGRGFALALLPLCWTAFEWAHSLGEFSYPWQALGYTQVYNLPMLQSADIAGVWGLTFVIVSVNACLAHILFAFSEGKIERNIEGKTEENAEESFVVRFTKTLYLRRESVVLLVWIFLITISYGAWRMRDFDHAELLARGQNVRMGIVQPSINPWGKWRGSPNEQVLLHLHLQDSLRFTLQQQHPPITRLDAVLWSETAIPYRILLPQNYPYLAMLHAWTDSTNTAILTGLPSDILYNSKKEAPITASVVPRLFDTLYMESFNSATVLTPTTRITPDSVPSAFPSGIQIHRKMHLTPFAERVPYAEAFSFAVKALTWGVGISGWGLGKEQKTLDFMTSPSHTTASYAVSVGMIICLESIYPNFVREYPLKGANILAIITNDGWFNGTPGPEQHYMIGAMRSVENRRYLARCGNTGISGFLTPTGTSLERTAINEQRAISAELPLLSQQTLYSRLGDWLPMLCAGIAVAMLLFSFKKTA
ncbi:MAG: apolipoprotein N-acyltransferase [Candidatus Kapaibacterium sp.]|nr:MAG: apolipoprotein N-acyltransferase [Candidatus Kapabacteria bacterium]